MSGRRLGIAAITVVTVLMAGVAVGAVDSGHSKPGRLFALTGHVSGLYPGVRRQLVIVVHNRGRRPLRIRSVTTRVRNASAECRGRNLRVSRFRGRLRLKARASRRIAVSVRMLPESPPACQGAVFPLVFRGRATGR
jgi:hypothetical protein